MSDTAINRRFTYGDYVQWQGDDRWELIDGEPHLMSPAPSRVHQKILGNLFMQIAGFLENHKCEAYIAPLDVRLPQGDEADEEVDTVVQPDLVVVCDASKLDDAGCRGAPDWVIEIASPSTAIRDLVKKRDLYERCSVLEYWSIEPRERSLTIFRLEGGRFLPGNTLKAEGKIEAAILPGLVLDLDRVFRT